MAAAIRIPPLPTVNDILRMYNIRAKKQLSQNFIMDPRLLNRIAKKCGPLEGKYVVEVGPGPGGITRSILGLGARRCIVIEKDPRFIECLSHLNTCSGNKMDIHIGDALTFNMQELFPPGIRREWEGGVPDIRLVANLPFNISTPLLIKWLRCMSDRSELFSYGRVPLLLTFQHEVAHRIMAAPGDRERSRLSVVAQNWTRANYEFTIPGGAFVPPPQVSVGLVSFRPLTKPYIDLPFPLVNKVVTHLFRGKNKFVLSNVKTLFPKKLEDKLGWDMLSLSDIEKNRTAISFTMDEMNRLCQAYNHLITMNPSLAAYTRYISEESEEEVLIGPPPCGENSNLLETAQPIIQSEARIQSSNQKRGL